MQKSPCVMEDYPVQRAPAEGRERIDPFSRRRVLHGNGGNGAEADQKTVKIHAQHFVGYQVAEEGCGADHQRGQIEKQTAENLVFFLPELINTAVIVGAAKLVDPEVISSIPRRKCNLC